MAQTLSITNDSNTNPSPNKGFMMSFEGVLVPPGVTKQIRFASGAPQKLLDLESAGDLTKTVISNENPHSATQFTALLDKLTADASTDNDYDVIIGAVV